MGRFDGKTEKATPQRRREARREGTVARSQEVGTAASLVAGVLVLRVAAPDGFATVMDETRTLLGTLGPDALDAAALWSAAGRMGAALAGPFIAASVVAAVVAGVAQVGFHLTPKAIQPKLRNLNPKQGLEKFRPSKIGWELVRTATKLGMLGVVMIDPLRSWQAEPLLGRSVDATVAAILALIWSVLVRTLAVAVVVAAADYAWNRFTTNKQMKMSKEDVKQEHKNSEGDPHVKGQRRRRQQELSRNRMLQDVSIADVIINNPTHLSVALVYTVEDGAPKVVAKGADKLALRIRAVAARHGVPMTEDVPLARALYRQTKVGHFVPAALFEAVAVVLATAYRRRGRGPRRRAEVSA